MKKFKIYAYLAGALFLLITAWFIFSNTGKISQLTSETIIYDQIKTNIQNLYISQLLALFIPFGILITLVYNEIILFYKEKKERERIILEQSLTRQEEIQEDPEEIRKQKELREKEQLEHKKKELLTCLDEKFRKNKPNSSKATSELILSCVAKVYELTQAEIFLRKSDDNIHKLELSATYAFYIPDEKVFEFEWGEGLIGQVAKAGESLYLDELPQGYITIKSGLGSATPSHLIIVPWKNKNNETFAVIEIASFKPFSKYDIRLIEELNEKLVEFYA
jgi:hypothetical protein